MAAVAIQQGRTDIGISSWAVREARRKRRVRETREKARKRRREQAESWVAE
jgi:hypothetical protein